MAQNNQTTGSNTTQVADLQKKVADLQKQVDHLAKIAGTAYSVSGYAPGLSEWQYTREQIEDIIRTHAKDYISDISDVTVEIERNGELSAYVWIPSNSSHITNTELNNPNSAINRTLKRYSPQMKEFMDKFCDKNAKRLLPSDDNSPVCGIMVRIDKFMEIELDRNGYMFGKLFGEKYKKPMNITMQAHFNRESGGGFGRFKYLSVSKASRSNRSRRRPIPKKSHNVRY